MSWLGLDIGGANLKAADARGWARTIAFPLWRNPNGLADAIATLLETAPTAARLAVTMTGELCDCFATKAEGVTEILSAVKKAAGSREVFVYLVDGRIVRSDATPEVLELAAASNWHALAQFACRFLDDRAGVLIDIGSTTTDIIPLVERQPWPTAFNDTDRLISGELVYTGVGRTPVCAITPWLPWRGARCPVAAEVFATAADAYVILGQIPEQRGATWTADGRALTRDLARARLARMLCRDTSTFDESDATQAAEAIREAQLAQLHAALNRVLARLGEQARCVVLSGAGEFLAAETAKRCRLASIKLISLARELGPEISTAGPAHALAILAGEAETNSIQRPSYETVTSDELKPHPNPIP